MVLTTSRPPPFSRPRPAYRLPALASYPALLRTEKVGDKPEVVAEKVQLFSFACNVVPTGDADTARLNQHGGPTSPSPWPRY